MIAVAPAIANALFAATGVRRTSLPLAGQEVTEPADTVPLDAAPVDPVPLDSVPPVGASEGAARRPGAGARG
jgi:hypothetical protein